MNETKCKNCGNYNLRLDCKNMNIGMGDKMLIDTLYCETCGKHWTLIAGEEVN